MKKMLQSKLPRTPLPLDVALRRGIEQHTAGQLPEAEKLYRTILAVQPKHPDALHNLGILAAQSGRYPEALEHLKAVVTAYPQHAQFWLSYAKTMLAAGHADAAHAVMTQAKQYGLAGADLDELAARIDARRASYPDLARLNRLEQAGHFDALGDEARRQIDHFGRVPALVAAFGKTLLLQGKIAQALACLEEACLALPEDVNVWNQRGAALKLLKRHDDAHACYLRALELQFDVDILANIADNLADAERFDEAVTWADKALAIDPRALAARVNKANVLIALQQHAEALSLLQSIWDEGIRHPHAMNSQASALQRLGELDQALAILDALGEVAPDHVEAWVTRSMVLLDKGGFAEAEALFQRARAIRPDLAATALAGLPRTRKMMTADLPWLAEMEQVIATGLGVNREYPLRYAMGKFCDDLHDYPAAFTHYARANGLKKQICPRYDPDNLGRIVDLLIESFGIDVVRQVQTGANQSRRPVFIVGMPRSGTSLTEQILASHPAVHGAGELRFWGEQLKSNQGAGLTAHFADVPLGKIAAAFMAELERHSVQALRVVDKMPNNFLVLGLIHAAFPEARILHTMRNPVDTCLSIYFQNFNLSYTYANDLSDIAHFYRQYHRLMAHWRQVLPSDVFMELPYEALVEDQEEWSRKIISFLGLDWDESCLDFHKTDRAVRTASNWQARQPIYKSSKERWRNYEPFIGPLLPLLELYDPQRGQR